MALIRFILIIIIAYYAIRFILRLATPFLINYLSKKMNHRGGNPFKNNSTYRKREGEVTIEDNQHKKKKVSDDVGEYVDYEEINE